MNIVRRVIFRPYSRKGSPSFILTVRDTGRREGSHNMLGYRLRSQGQTLFEGEDFGCPSMHAIDSDETVASIMSFLTIRPGDTDWDYFRHYTPEQFAYCSSHAEALANEVYHRFER